MGCDIHLYREKLVNGHWMTADEWDNDGHVPYKKQAYTGRNYELFGYLCKGVRTEHEYSHEARGLAAGMSPEVTAAINMVGVDGHSHSYRSLAELKADVEFLATQTTQISGMMEREQWSRLQASIATGSPEWGLLFPYCKMTTASGYVDFTVDVPATFYFGSDIQKIVDSFNGIDGEDHRIVFFFDN